MTGSSPGSGGLARGSPLLITAELSPDIAAWTNALRRKHYPAERMRLGAHVTLFHGLPPSIDSEVRHLLAEQTGSTPPTANIVGLMDLGRGTAFAVSSPEMMAIHAELAERLHGAIQQKDTRAPQLHITVQNKVPVGDARLLQQELSQQTLPGPFRFRGLGLYYWLDDLWQLARLYSFRGQH